MAWERRRPRRPKELLLAHHPAGDSAIISSMVKSYTAKYTKIDSGYMGQLIEWPEVVTEGEGIEECRWMLRDGLREMILAYQQQGKEIPLGTGCRR